MGHYRLLREIQSERNERYQVFKEKELRDKKEEFERQLNSDRDQLIKERNALSVESSKHEAVVREIQSLRR